MNSPTKLCLLGLALGVLACQSPPSIQAKKHGIWDAMYTEYLEGLSEPSFPKLANRDPSAEAYRFLWLRSFHDPICIRINRQEDRILTTVKIGDYGEARTKRGGDYGYAPGPVFTREISTLELSKEEWERLAEKLKNLSFAPLPPEADGIGVDGANWLLEEIVQGRYRRMERWSPESTDKEFREACLYFLYLAKLRIPPREIY